jgi:hypothetical protein
MPSWAVCADEDGNSTCPMSTHQPTKSNDSREASVNMLKAKVLDSTHLQLFEPISEINGKTVFVIIAESDDMDNEHQQWLSLSLRRLQSGYCESEPVYATSMVREKNPEYGS